MIPLEELNELIKTAENTVIVDFDNLSTSAESVAILAMIDFIDKFVDRYKDIYETMTFSSEEVAIVYENKNLTIEQNFIACNNSITFDILYCREVITKSLNKMHNECYDNYVLVRDGFKKIVDTIYEYLREERFKLIHPEDEKKDEEKSSLNKEELLSILIDLTVGDNKANMDIDFLRNTYYDLIKKIKDTNNITYIALDFSDLINSDELRYSIFGQVVLPRTIRIVTMDDNYKRIDIYQGQDTKIYSIENLDFCTNDSMLEGSQNRVLLKNIIISLILTLIKNIEMFEK